MIGTTNICNLKCFMCGTKDSAVPKGFITRDMYEHVVNQCARMGVRNIALHTVGEPLLHRDLVAQIGYAKGRGLHVFLSTNGQLLTDGMIEKLLSTELDAIRISIEGAGKETYESVRIGASFEKLIGNLESLMKRRTRRGSSLRIFITSILMKKTVSEIALFYQIFRPLCDDMYFTFLANPGRQVPDIENDMYLKQSQGTSPCRLLWNTPSVSFDGQVSACCLDFNNQLVVGNLREQNLRDIWLGPRYEYFRRLHRERRLHEMPLCGECNKDVNSPLNLLLLNLRAHLLACSPSFSAFIYKRPRISRIPET
ncbi:MAG: radical SAM protein [Deltaproteobacteria bacterium]|nr:radical SAM protein [Deltaproteobacteria bacterium]